MRNFYYIQTYNLMNPGIRLMLDSLGIFAIHDSLADLKVRSKYFVSYSEILKHAQDDFRKKLPKIFPVSDDPKSTNENAIKGMTIMNPKFSMIDQDDERLVGQEWDDDCIGSMFFCNAASDDDESDDFPTSWMVRYEIFFEDDVIQLVLKNGEHAFDPAAVAYQSFSSALH